MGAICQHLLRDNFVREQVKKQKEEEEEEELQRHRHHRFSDGTIKNKETKKTDHGVQSFLTSQHTLGAIFDQLLLYRPLYENKYQKDGTALLW